MSSNPKNNDSIEPEGNIHWRTRLIHSAADGPPGFRSLATSRELIRPRTINTSGRLWRRARLLPVRSLVGSHFHTAGRAGWTAANTKRTMTRQRRIRSFSRDDDRVSRPEVDVVLESSPRDDLLEIDLDVRLRARRPRR